MFAAFWRTKTKVLGVFAAELTSGRKAPGLFCRNQPPGILKYVGALRWGLSADIGRKDFFEMASDKRFENYWGVVALAAYGLVIL